MKHLVITQSAANEILKIWNYIARDSLDSADQVRNDLQKAMVSLCEQPGMGHERSDVKSKNYRFWPVYSYLIVYYVENEKLYVLRVLHGAQNIRRIAKRWRR